MNHTHAELLEMLLGHVRKMRTAQREFFATRSRTALADSKAAEHLVDRVLSEIDSGQQSLQFEAEPPGSPASPGRAP